MKKLIALILLTAYCLPLLTSCGKFVPTEKGLITAPTLFEEQKEITRALKASVGNDIVLQYPKTGQNRSAFLIEDINSDGKDEVVAFYSPKGEGAGQYAIHINLLSKNDDGQWRSLCDVVGEANGIDRVSVGTFSGKTEIIVGWELIKEREKTLVGYSLKNRTLVRDFTRPYVEFAVADFWKSNAGDELITINYSKTEQELTSPTQNAHLIVKTKNKFKEKSSCALDFRVTGYKSCTAGKYDSRNTGYFLDSMLDSATVTTQILTVSKEGKIKNPLLVDGKTADDNTHKSTMLSQDINGDGVLEVPHQQEIVGYEDVPESEKLFKTVWKNLIENELKKSFAMYMNTALGIRVMLSTDFEQLVTMRTVSAQNEIVFYEYNTSLKKSTTELFRLRVFQRGEYEEKDGFEALCSNDYITVAVKIASPQNPLCPSWEEIFEIVDIL